MGQLSLMFWVLGAETDAGEEEDWLLDSKPLWLQTIASATRLAAHSEQLRRDLSSDPKVKQWLADSRGAEQGQTHVKELSPLLDVLIKS